MDGGGGPAGNTGVDGRGGGPAGNTGMDGRGEDEEEEEKEEEKATNIKSNNPHLAGGEKHKVNIHKQCRIFCIY